jgi:hypothetical protein
MGSGRGRGGGRWGRWERSRREKEMINPLLEGEGEKKENI